MSEDVESNGQSSKVCNICGMCHAPENEVCNYCGGIRADGIQWIKGKPKWDGRNPPFYLVASLHPQRMDTDIAVFDHERKVWAMLAGGYDHAITHYAYPKCLPLPTQISEKKSSIIIT